MVGVGQTSEQTSGLRITRNLGESYHPLTRVRASSISAWGDIDAVVSGRRMAVDLRHYFII